MKNSMIEVKYFPKGTKPREIFVYTCKRIAEPLIQLGYKYRKSKNDAAIRGRFDTLQIINDINIPNGKWGTVDWLEPLTKDFPEFGVGGATQAVTKKAIKLDKLEHLH